MAGHFERSETFRTAHVYHTYAHPYIKDVYFVCKITLYSGVPVKGNKQDFGVKQLNWRNNYKIEINKLNVIPDTMWR